MTAKKRDLDVAIGIMAIAIIMRLNAGVRNGRDEAMLALLIAIQARIIFLR